MYVFSKVVKNGLPWQRAVRMRGIGLIFQLTPTAYDPTARGKLAGVTNVLWCAMSQCSG